MAQEIQKKYKNLSKAREEHLSSGKRQSEDFKQQAPKRQLVKTEKKMESGRKENSQDYMRSTAAADLKASKLKNLPPKVNKVKIEQQQKMKEECTFQPRINPTPYDSKLEINKEERLNRLYKSKTTDIQKREKMKQVKDAEEFANKCTVHPQIESICYFLIL